MASPKGAPEPDVESPPAQPVEVPTYPGFQKKMGSLYCIAAKELKLSYHNGYI